MNVRSFCLLLAWLAVCGLASANPAPKPVLRSPGQSAWNVDPDPTLAWRWTDELISNGSFETGLTPGWYAGGTSPNVWRVYADTTNRYGMGYCWATTVMPSAPSAMGQVIQDLYIPADATSATLVWSERVFNLTHSWPTIGKFRVWLAQGGVSVALLESATGLEPAFSSPGTWVSRSTNLLAYAGQYVQLIFQADSYSPQAYFSWFADVDGVGLACEHASNTPDFQVYLGNSYVLRETNLIGTTSGFEFASVQLASSNTYYWRVGAVRDNVTNFSLTGSFRTGQRVLPQLTVKQRTDTGVRFSFATRTNRYYAIEQSDALGENAHWYDVLFSVPGDGNALEYEVPLPWGESAFWRLRVTP